MFEEGKWLINIHKSLNNQYNIARTAKCSAKPFSKGDTFKQSTKAPYQMWILKRKQKTIYIYLI